MRRRTDKNGFGTTKRSCRGGSTQQTWGSKHEDTWGYAIIHSEKFDLGSFMHDMSGSNVASKKGHFRFTAAGMPFRMIFFVHWQATKKMLNPETSELPCPFPTNFLILFASIFFCCLLLSSRLKHSNCDKLLHCSWMSCSAPSRQWAKSGAVDVIDWFITGLCHIPL